MSHSFDHAFKRSVEDEELGILRVVAKLHIPPGAEVSQLDRELVPPSLRVDHLYRITTAEGATAVHLEAFSSYKSNWQRRHARYAALIWAKHELKLTIFMFLLTDRGVPKSLEEDFEIDACDLRLRMHVRIVRMWEIPAHDLLETGNANVAAWVPLTDHSAEQFWKAARLVRDSGDPELQGRMVLLNGLRYGGSEVLQMMLSDEILQESSYYQEILNRGVAKGREQGIEQGRAEGHQEGERRILRRLLIEKFRELPPFAEDKLGASSQSDLDRWASRILRASCIEEVFE